MRGVGISTGALGSGILETAALAAPAGNVAGPGAVPVTLKINGKPYNLNIEPRVTLIDALRNHLESHRREESLRPGNLRRLHRHHGRQGGL